VLLIGIAGLLIIYIIQTRSIITEHRNELRDIATTVAGSISVVDHESLQKQDQITSSTYRAIEDQLRTIMAGNPTIDDVYTLRPTAQSNIFTFVVSAQETSDENENGLIDENEQKPALGERYDASSQPDLVAALRGPTADRKVTYDKWGAWLSGYAPIRDDHGKAVAIVGVDYPATEIVRHRKLVTNSLVTAFFILLPIALLGALLIGRRLSQPFHVLAEGMDRVAHGDRKYRLPMHGHHEEAIFAQLFNNMLNIYNPSERPRQPGVEDEFAEKK
jgi:methyl-accepting chemotaxis protein